MGIQSADFAPELEQSLCSNLLNSIRGIVWEADPVTLQFNYVNSQAERLLGYPCRQWVDEPDFWRNHTHPEDVEWCTAYSRAAAAKGQDHEFEFRMVAADGSVVWLHDIVSIVTDAEGGVRLRGIMTPIAQSKRAEMQLNSDQERSRLAMRAANDPLYDGNLPTDEFLPKRPAQPLNLHEHFQRALLDNFPFAAWMKDKEGVYRDANGSMATYYGLSSPEEMLGKSAHDFFPPEVADLIDAEAQEVLKSGRSMQSEKRLPVNGGDHWFDFHQSPLCVDGQLLGTVGCAWDITERKLMEKELAESEERYRKVVEVSPEAMFVHYRGRFVFLNLAAAKLLGAGDPEELYGRLALDFVHPDQRETVARRIENAWQHNDNPLVEELLVRLDGSTVQVEMVSVHFIYKGRESVLAIARDISERIRMQDERVRTQKLESLGVLAGGIAHDFNNILTGILGNLSLVRLQLDTPENVAKGIERCERAALRASELTQQLLTFSRGGDPVRKLVDPALLIRESVSFVLRGSHFGHELAITADLWCIEADPGQVNQLLSNLLINSMQAMPEGGVIRIRSCNQVVGPKSAVNLPAGNYLKIVIEDQGHGIPAANLSKIFDPFFTTKEQGHGLGLASVYSIVKRHGGEIAVSSTVGAGSRFTIHLPAEPEKRFDREKCDQDRLQRGNGKVLVMDDEEIIREIATRTLEFAGYRVESCGDGREAVERYRSSHGSDPFDVVIMDLTIPGGMGGREAAGCILGFDPDASLIVSSGYCNDPVMSNFRQFGFKGAVVKPFSAGLLAAEVHRLTGVKTSPQ